MRFVSLYYLSTILFVYLINLSSAYGQNQVKEQEGTVSYITSQNVYIRFDDTNMMKLNDTIYVLNGGKKQACLILLETSSVSCIAQRIGDCTITKGDKVVYTYKEAESTTSSSESENENAPIKKDTILPVLVEKNSTKPKQDISGRISLANYSTAGNSNEMNNKTVARLSLNADNILGSKLSFFSYSNFRYNTISNQKQDRQFNRLNIYQIALRYDVDSNLSISVGRQFNSRMYSIGATDGIHSEKRWKKGFVGIVAGSKPDPYTYNLNINLLQYGAYIGMMHNKSGSTSLGFIDQRNKGLTDRRYTFLQHNSNIGKKVNIFSTAQADLFDKDVLGNTTNSFQLTSLYLSVNYRATKKLRLTASYDLRKNVILYESYGENLDILTTNDPLKTGYRLRVNYTMAKNTYAGASINLRTQSDKKNSFTNYNAFLNFSQLPGIGGRLSNSLNINRNEYFQYNSFSTRYTKRFIENKLSLSPSFRFITYSYINYEIDPLKQIYLSFDAYYTVKKDLSIGALYDYSRRSVVGFHRFNINVIKRF